MRREETTGEICRRDTSTKIPIVSRVEIKPKRISKQYVLSFLIDDQVPTPFLIDEEVPTSFLVDEQIFIPLLVDGRVFIPFSSLCVELLYHKEIGMRRL